VHNVNEDFYAVIASGGHLQLLIEKFPEKWQFLADFWLISGRFTRTFAIKMMKMNRELTGARCPGETFNGSCSVFR